MITKLKEIIEDTDLNYICFKRNSRNNYCAIWLFKTKFERNGKLNNLTKKECTLLWNYLDDVVYMVKTTTHRGNEIIYVNGRSITTYIEEELNGY